MKHIDANHPSDMLIFRSLEESEREITGRNLVNLRTRYFKADHTVHLHYHNTLEIDINRGVTGSGRIDGNPIDLADHDIIVTIPGIMHSYDFKKGPGEFDVLHISITRLRKLLNLEELIGDGLDRVRFADASYNGIAPLVEKMKALDENDTFAQLQIILAILRILTEGDSSRQNTSGTISFIKEIINYTEKHYSESITLPDIAQLTDLSVSYISRMFKRQTGTSYITYLQMLRIDRAKNYLLSGESVTDCCYSCGFENVSYFIQIFKRYNNGLSPKAFVKIFTNSLSGS